MKILQEYLKEVAEEGADRSFQSNYQGRYMYGKGCLGIVCENPIVVAFNVAENIMIDLYENALRSDNDVPAEEERRQAEDLMALLKEFRVDTMGLDKIIYWPSVSYTEIEEEEIERDPNDPVDFDDAPPFPGHDRCCNYPKCGCDKEFGESCIPF